LKNLGHARAIHLLFRAANAIEVSAEWHQIPRDKANPDFIFHMSRLVRLGRMLSDSIKRCDFGTSRPIDSTLRARFASTENTDESANHLAALMVTHWVSGWLAEERSFFIKFLMPGILWIASDSPAFPEVPWIFLYRCR